MRRATSGGRATPVLPFVLWLRISWAEGFRKVRGHSIGFPTLAPKRQVQHVVVDLKVLVSSVYDDDPEHIKISVGESFFLELAKAIFFFAKDLAKD